jgi:hypothetical protein
MQEMIEDILTDYGMRPNTSVAGPPLITVAASAEVATTARHYAGSLAEVRA